MVLSLVPSSLKDHAAMPESRDELDKRAKNEWEFGRRCEREGDHRMANDAYDRAIEYERCRDSFLYRWFGW